MAMKGEVPPCSEQKHALGKAIAELRHIEEKRKVTKHWGHIVDREAQEWQARVQQFAQLLEGHLPQALARLDQMIAALEKYAQGSIPAGPSAVSIDAPLDEPISPSNDSSTATPLDTTDLDATS
jgi:hypothetical protein